MKKRNKFSLSNYRLATCNQGELVPIGIQDVLPGDTFQQSTTALIRVSPLLAPVMHPVHARIHHWFVPYRLLWDNGKDDSWEAFITGGHDGLDASTFPTIDVSSSSVGSLADHMGLPTGVANMPVVSALPFRAYALIFNEFYRDQDLGTELTIDTTGGTDTTTNTSLKNVNWEKDYFTSARPWTQKGSEVSMPLGTSAPIYGNQDFDNVEDSGNYIQIRAGSGTGALRRLKVDTNHLYGGNDSNGTGEIFADLSNATAATINDLREKFALQKYKEVRARYGSRYSEYLRYLGVNPSDSRLQRPEYLGGGKQTIQFSEVLQTAPTTSGSTAGIADLKGHGIAAMRSNRYRKYFEEHGVVLTLMSVQPKTIYAEGIPKMWSKTTKEDFFQKELQHIGQEEVYNKEIYAAHTTPEGTFGYQDRYDEYRRSESSVSGDFNDGSNLDHWHMARFFSSDPTLNETFVASNPTNRIYASTTDDQLYIMANHSIQARRLVAKNGTPKLF
jgi:hypothetical protein